MAFCADVDVSQGSVATYATCGCTFDYLFNYKFTKESLNETKKLNRFRFDRIVTMRLWPTFSAHPVGH